MVRCVVGARGGSPRAERWAGWGSHRILSAARPGALVPIPGLGAAELRRSGGPPAWPWIRHSDLAPHHQRVHVRRWDARGQPDLSVDGARRDDEGGRRWPPALIFRSPRVRPTDGCPRSAFVEGWTPRRLSFSYSAAPGSRPAART